MSRFPYEMIAVEANRLIDKMALATNYRLYKYYWELYVGYITACGWTDWEFDRETMRRIDAAWDNRRFTRQN